MVFDSKVMAQKQQKLIRGLMILLFLGHDF